MLGTGGDLVSIPFYELRSISAYKEVSSHSLSVMLPFGSILHPLPKILPF